MQQPFWTANVKLIYARRVAPPSSQLGGGGGGGDFYEAYAPHTHTLLSVKHLRFNFTPNVRIPREKPVAETQPLCQPAAGIRADVGKWTSGGSRAWRGWGRDESATPANPSSHQTRLCGYNNPLKSPLSPPANTFADRSFHAKKK